MVLCGSVVGALLLLHGQYRPVLVRGGSMRPTFQDGQVVLMDLRHYRTHSIRTGDIVIFRCGRDTCIKRVYATAGAMVDLARFRDGGTFLIETIGYPSRVRHIFRHNPQLGDLLSLRVPEHKLFVVGDNPCLSDDSRDYGPIPESAVIGYVDPPAPSRSPSSDYADRLVAGPSSPNRPTARPVAPALMRLAALALPRPSEPAR